MDRLKPFIGPAEISEMVERVAAEIDADCSMSCPVIIGVLKGASFFVADLARSLTMDFELDFIQTACYGMRDEPSAEVLIQRDITTEVKGRDVVVVEDIIDRGHTARVLTQHLASRGARSVRLCTLLRRASGAPGLKVDYTGVSIGEGFVVGYGMDYKERYRGLKGLYMLEQDDG